MRALVTGGAGFIGSHVVDGLRRLGVEVAVLDDLSTGRRENVPPGVALYPIDLRDRAGVGRAFAEFRPEHVFHLGAQVSVKVSVDDPPADAAVNVVGGLHVLDAAVAAGTRRVVFSSTGGALYGEVGEGPGAGEGAPPRPKSPYGAAKAAFEIYLDVYRQLFGLSAVALRYANVYGPRQDPFGEAGVVAIFAERLLAGKPVTVFARRTPGDGGCVRDYVFAEDVAAANLLTLERGGEREGVYNVGTGIGRTTADVLAAIAAAAGVEPEVIDGPPRAGDLEASRLDPARIGTFGWKPAFSFEEGIARTVAWFRDRSRRGG